MFAIWIGRRPAASGYLPPDTLQVIKGRSGRKPACGVGLIVGHLPPMLRLHLEGRGDARPTDAKVTTLAQRCYKSRICTQALCVEAHQEHIHLRWDHSNRRPSGTTLIRFGKLIG